MYTPLLFETLSATQTETVVVVVLTCGLVRVEGVLDHQTWISPGSYMHKQGYGL